MSDVLTGICARKAEHVALKKTARSLNDLLNEVKNVPPPLPFIKALEEKEGYSIIAEVKKASPSKGVIRENFDAVEIAKIYENNGAACLSVLTDEPYFQGHDDYIQAVKATVSIPVLRKDFMIDPYQIVESRILGADCILIIMAALDDSQAQDLHESAIDLGMDALIEVHDAEECERALKLNPKMIGVNNRNLKTLDVSHDTGLELNKLIPDSVFKVAESGLYTHDDLHKFSDAGYNAYLIGESLMRQDDIGSALKNLVSQS
ncbi:MAG: indole-3-glycerol phosphate synthase TrpC [Pseudomonadota bacterium]